jgi:hypothetical protein
LKNDTPISAIIVSIKTKESPSYVWNDCKDTALSVSASGSPKAGRTMPLSEDAVGRRERVGAPFL